MRDYNSMGSLISGDVVLGGKGRRKSNNMLFGSGYSPEKQKKKRETLTPAQRVYVWEHPEMYGRTCHICHQRITELSDLEADHISLSF
jgi:hypothetical protein